MQGHVLPLPYLHPAGSSATAPAHARWQRDQEERAGEKSPQKRQAEPHSLTVLAGQGGGLLAGTSDAIVPWGLLKSLHHQGICRGPLTSPAPLPPPGAACSGYVPPGNLMPSLISPLLSSLLRSMPLCLYFSHVLPFIPSF